MQQRHIAGFGELTAENARLSIDSMPMA